MTIRAFIPARTMPAFGTPGSIDPIRLFRLPPAAQREGVMLLLEMGQTSEQVAARLHLSPRQVRAMIAHEPAPIRRGGESDAD